MVVSLNNLPTGLSRTVPILRSETASVQSSVRFGNEAADGENKLHEDAKQLDQRMKNLRYITVNESPADFDVPVSRGKKKLKKGGWPIFGMLALALMGVFGFGQYRTYRTSLPEPVVGQREVMLQKEWGPLSKTLREAQSLGAGSEVKGQFNRQLQSFLIRTMMTVRDYPAGKVDTQMLARIFEIVSTDQSFTPDIAVSDLAAELETYCRSVNLPSNPTRPQINQALKNLQRDFIANSDFLSHLSPADQEQLVKDIKDAIYNNRFDVQVNSNYSHIFKNTLDGVVKAGSYAGLDLAEFLRTFKGEAHSREGAKALVKEVFSDQTNYKSLTAQQRETAVKQASIVLDSIDHYIPSPMWGFTAGLAALLGLLGALGLGVWKRENLAEVPGGIADLWQGIQNPVLFVENVDEGANVEGGTKAVRLNRLVNQKAAQIAAAVRTVFENNAKAKDFMLEVYGDAGKLPNADYIRQRYTYPVVTEFLSEQGMITKLRQSPASQLAFFQKLSEAMESAVYTGELFTVDPADIPKAATKKSGLSNKQILENERARIDALIAASMKTYVNSQLAKTLATQEIARLEKQAENISDRVAALAEQGVNPGNDPKGELGNLLTLNKQTGDDLEDARAILADAESLADHAEDSLEDYIDPLREYRGRLNQAIVDSNFTKTAEELQQVKDASGQLRTDPKLAEALHQQKVEQFVQEQKSKRAKLDAEIEARIQKHMEKRQQTQAESAS